MIPPSAPNAAPDAPPDVPPPDLRLVPAALASWAVAVVALVAGWGAGAGLGVLAGGLALAGAARCRREPGTEPGATRAPPALAAVMLAGGGAAAAVALVSAVSVHAVAAHPLRPATAAGAAATLDVVVTSDPRPVRGAVPGPGQVTIRAELVGGEVAGARWRSGGRVLLIASADSWGGLLPGQAVTARGRVTEPDRADLTVAVLRTRAPPAAVGPVPAAQDVAGALRDGLREAAGAVLAEDPAGLLPGLVVGDVSRMPSDLADDFRTAGLSHLTAVSGTNVKDGVCRQRNVRGHRGRV